MDPHLCYVIIGVIFGTCAILNIVVCSWIISYEKGWRQGDYFQGDVSYLSQIGNDWNIAPFQDILVTEETQCPDTHPDLVAYDVWYGTNMYCDCIEKDGTVHYDRKCEHDDGDGGQQHHSKCYNVFAHAPVVQS